MSMDPWILDTLLDACSGYVELEGDTETLAWLAETGIGMAELELLKDLDLEVLDATDDGTIIMTTNSPLVDKPAGLVSTRELGILLPDSANSYKQLLPRSRSFMSTYWPNEALTDEPEYFCEWDDTRYRVAPTPDNDYPVRARIIKRPDGLLAATPSATYLSTNFPDALLFGTLHQVEVYLQETAGDGSMTQYEKEYVSRLPKHARERRRERRRDFKPLRPMPVAQKQPEEE